MEIEEGSEQQKEEIQMILEENPKEEELVFERLGDSSPIQMKSEN